jgi:hypothetical protein
MKPIPENARHYRSAAVAIVAGAGAGILWAVVCHNLPSARAVIFAPGAFAICIAAAFFSTGRTRGTFPGWTVWLSRIVFAILVGSGSAALAFDTAGLLDGYHPAAFLLMGPHWSVLAPNVTGMALGLIGGIIGVLSLPRHRIAGSVN